MVERLRPRVQQIAEELLRYEGPVERALNRWATEDVELGGKTIRRGEGVIVILGSADRDPARFRDPGVLDFARVDNKHLAFGRSSHYCLGAPLARLEAETAVGSGRPSASTGSARDEQTNKRHERIAFRFAPQDPERR
jgi:cytochrome P450